MKKLKLRLAVALFWLVCATGCGAWGRTVPIDRALEPTAPAGITSPTSIAPLAMISEASAQGSAQPKQFAFVSDRRKRGSLDVWLFDVTSGRVEPLTSDDSQNVKPAWSPDGSVLAYSSLKPSALRVITFPDRVIRSVASPEPHEEIDDFVWSPDGRSLFYTTYDSRSFQLGVWQHDLQIGSRKHVAGGVSPLAVSRDGRYLAFVDRNPNPKTRFDPRVLRVVRLSDGKELPADYSGAMFEIAWSPTADELAVTGEGLTIYGVEGDQLRRRANKDLADGAGTPKILCNPQWSPDGQRLLVILSSIGNVCNGEFQLYNAQAMFTEWGMAAPEGLAGYPRWSRDGEWILHGRNDTLNVEHLRNNVLELLEGQLWIMESRQVLDMSLIKDCSYNGQPTWRP